MNNFHKLIGFSAKEAREKVKNEYYIRVIKKDGEEIPYSSELAYDRINVALKNELICEICFLG